MAAPVVEPGGGTQTLERARPLEDARPQTSHGGGDHERFAHYVRKDKIVDSAVLGDAVMALCGKVWVPSRDPQKFPVCPTCKELYESMSAGDPDEGGGS